MMRFHPTEEQLAIQEAVYGTLESVWLPRLDEFVDMADADFDRESWDALMALGLGGLLVSEEQGGTGLGLVDAALVLEMAGQAAASGPIAAQILAAGLVSRCEAGLGDDLQQSLVDGSAVATLALGGDWVPGSWDVEFDGMSVNGAVRFVLSARAADFFIVGAADNSLLLVEKGPHVSIEPLSSSDNTRRTSLVCFASAPARLLCSANDPQVSEFFDGALVLSAAEALGAAQHCVDLSVSYAKEREQFGQPIGRFQGLKHQLVDMALAVEPARALLWYAAYAHDADLQERSRVAALAKAHIVDCFVAVARGAVAAHGGIGYTWEYGLSHWFRRSLHDHAWLGRPVFHRTRAAEMANW